MAQKHINTDIPNSGNGDTLRDAFVKTEDNFTELYNAKVDKISGKGLSTNDYTTAEKDKLEGIPADAEKNVQSDWLENDPDSDSFILNKPDVIGSVEWGNIEGNIEDQEDLQNTLESKQNISEKDSPNGYAGLDADGKILRSQLPSTTIIPIANFLIFKIGSETPYELEVGDLVQGIVENFKIEAIYLGGDTALLESFDIINSIDLLPEPIEYTITIAGFDVETKTASVTTNYPNGTLLKLFVVEDPQINIDTWDGYVYDGIIDYSATLPDGYLEGGIGVQIFNSPVYSDVFYF